VTSEEIPAALAGQRIDRVVAMLTGCSRADAAAALAGGSVDIDGVVVVKPSTKVAEGQRVTLSVDPVRVEPAPVADPSIEVRTVYEDDHVIVVDKPAGLVVHPAPGHFGGTLVHGLLARYPELVDVGGDPIRPGIVHRLDKGTSGLLVVARTEVAHGGLVEQLQDHLVDRHYTALVWGLLDTPLGTIDAPIGRSRRDPLRMAVAATGRESRTHYEVRGEYSTPAELSLLQCRLETGRTHQIRVHLKSIGRPVVGDELYGGARRTLSMDRPFLHATDLNFDHPVTGERLHFHSDPPADLQAVLAKIS
jgi:23S rRNA pseudouridine1911/1915/1917 synthase